MQRKSNCLIGNLNFHVPEHLYFDHDARTSTFFVIVEARAEKPLLY